MIIFFNDKYNFPDAITTHINEAIAEFSKVGIDYFAENHNEAFRKMEIKLKSDISAGSHFIWRKHFHRLFVYRYIDHLFDRFTYANCVFSRRSLESLERETEQDLVTLAKERASIFSDIRFPRPNLVFFEFGLRCDFATVKHLSESYKKQLKVVHTYQHHIKHDKTKKEGVERRIKEIKAADRSLISRISSYRQENK